MQLTPTDYFYQEFQKRVFGRQSWHVYQAGKSHSFIQITAFTTCFSLPPSAVGGGSYGFSNFFITDP